MRLTSHSSRTRFAGRLNSGVRRFLERPVRFLFLTTALCLLVAPALAGNSSSLDSAVVSALGKSTPYLHAASDLNRDGQPDAIVLAEGSDWCGSGGCTLLIFKGTPRGYAFVSRSTITAPPIRVLPSTHGGWSDLIVHSNGTGDVVLRFDGARYPHNPSLEPAATRTQLRSSVEVLSQTPNNSFKPNPLRGSA